MSRWRGCGEVVWLFCESKKQSIHRGELVYEGVVDFDHPRYDKDSILVNGDTNEHVFGVSMEVWWSGSGHGWDQHRNDDGSSACWYVRRST